MMDKSDDDKVMQQKPVDGNTSKQGAGDESLRPSARDDMHSEADTEIRRRLLKGIVASGPVIASVTSRPVLAARNCTESGQLSGNASGPEEECPREGCGALFWSDYPFLSLTPYESYRSFADVFYITNSSLFDMFSGVTLHDALTLSQRELDEGKHLGQIKHQLEQTGKDYCAHLGQGNGQKDEEILKIVTILLAVEGTAALLNALSPDVSYLLHSNTVMTEVGTAINGQNCQTMQDLKEFLAVENRLGSDLCAIGGGAN